MTRAKPDSFKLFLVKALFFALLSTAPMTIFAQNSHYSDQGDDDFFFYDYSEVADTPVLYDSPASQEQNGKSDLIIIYPSSHEEGSYYNPEPEPKHEKKREKKKTSRNRQDRKSNRQNQSRQALPPGIPAFTSYPDHPDNKVETIKARQNRKPLPAAGNAEKTFINPGSAYVPPVIQSKPAQASQNTETAQEPKAPVIADSYREKFHKPDEVKRGAKSFASDDLPEVTSNTNVTAMEIPGKQFSAITPPGKPAVGSNDKTVHFYNDAQPLVTAPPPDPDYDPDFADFEASRIIPIIDAPAGFYDFSFEGQGIQIAASHTFAGVEIKAGQVVALNMITTNNSGADRVFKEKISTPKGINGVHEISAFEIKAGKSISRRISLHLDSALGAGEHHVSYELTCKKSPMTSGRLDFTFAIKAAPGLAFELMPTSERLEQKRPFKAAGKLINTGNAGLNIHLKARGRVKDLRVSPIRVSLPAGGHAIVEISGLTPERNNPLDDLLQLTLSAVSDKKSGSLQLLDTPLRLRISSVK